MATADIKTQPTNASATYFVASIEDEPKRQDAMAINALMRRITGATPKMWGDSIVGFGRAHFKYASGRQGEWFLVGFAPRKSNLVLYIMPGFSEYGALLKKLGKFRTGKSCLYINKLADVDITVLERLVASSVASMKKGGADSDEA